MIGGLAYVLLALVWEFATGPRFVLYGSYVLVSLVIVLRAGRLAARSVLALVVLALAGYLVRLALSGILGPPRWQYVAEFSWPVMTAQTGAMCLALLIVLYLDPNRRAHLLESLFPHTEQRDPVRASLLVVLAVLALFTAGRSFTGPMSFEIDGFLTACDKIDISLDDAAYLRYDVPLHSGLDFDRWQDDCPTA